MAIRTHATDRQSPEGQLVLAVRLDDSARLQELLAQGVSANTLNEHGIPVLHIAVCTGHLKCTLLLLEQGAQTDILHPTQGQAPLHGAVWSRQVETLRLLLAHKADANIRDKDDASTPLHYAAAMGWIQAVQLLLEHGADVTIRDRHGKTPVDDARQNGWPDVAKLLLDHVSRKHAARLKSLRRRRGFRMES